MSKELNFQDGNDVLKYQDSSSTLKLYLSENGLPFDLSRLDNITLKVGNDNGYLLEKVVDQSTITDPTSGNLTIPLDGDIMTKLIPDDYNIEIWTQVNPVIYSPEANDVNITIADTGLEDTQAIFPSDGNLVITVDENIKSDPYDTINAYPLDDVWNSIAEWKTDTVNSMTNQLSDQLGTEIRTWQGDIAVSLKNELLNDIATDEGTIRQQLHDILETSLDNLINKEISDLKSSVGEDVHNAMISDVANQIATIKPEITSDLHTDLTNELSSELTTALQNWESSTDNDLNNKLAQAIVDKTTTMQNNLSSELTNYLQGKLNDYETTASQNITNTITQQVTQSIASQFTSEDSQVRTDLENLVKGTIQTDINNTLQQMQENGDIYATKQEFTDFTNTINADLQKLDLANDIGKQISTINNKINTLSPLINGYSQYNANEFGTDFNAYVTPGFYTVNNMQNNLPNGLTQGIVQVGYYDSSNDVTQLFWDNQGNVYNRGESQGSWNAWTKIVNQNDFNNLQVNVSNLDTNAVSFQGNVPTSTLQAITKDGIYSLAGGSYSDAPYEPIYGIVNQTGVGLGVQTQVILDNIGDMYYRVINSWGIKGWYQVANNDDIKAINQTLATKANQTDLQSLANNVNTNVANSMSSLQSVVSTKASQGDLQNLSSAVSSTLNTQISSLQSSVGANSSAIASNASSASSAISNNANNINTLSGNSLTWKGHLHGSDDLNNINYTSIFEFASTDLPANFPPNLATASWGTWGTVETIMWTGAKNFGVQKVYSTTSNQNNVIAYRFLCNSWNSWSFSVSQTDINNVQTAVNQVQSNLSTLQSQAWWGHGSFTQDIYNLAGNQSGIYDVSGATINTPPNYSGTGMCEVQHVQNSCYLTFKDVNGSIWTNAHSYVNGNWSGWLATAGVIIAQNAQQAQSINAPANTIVISEN